MINEILIEQKAKSIKISVKKKFDSKKFRAENE